MCDHKIYPLTVTEITDTQRRDPLWKSFFKEKDQQREFCKVIINETGVLVKDQNQLAVPKALRVRTL